MMHQLDVDLKEYQALIMAPTRELTQKIRLTDPYVRQMIAGLM
jgi:superfamily II DNA/RNA helicase